MIGKIDQCVAAKDVPGLKGVLNDMVQENVPLNDSRPVINHVAKSLSKLDNESTLELA